MDIKETFLKLTTKTYPHGFEHELFDILPQNLDMDEFGNLFFKIGESDVMFTSHLDTATSAKTDVKHVIQGDFINTDGKSILGADDKAGVTIMLYMMEKKIPGLYYFFLGEEVGCVGSKQLAAKHKITKIPYINKVVSFDRRGYDSIITFQASSRCCSDKFGKALAEQLNKAQPKFHYENDSTGVYTDSAEFTKIYPECTNISVGYDSEHTFRESQNIKHLELLAIAATKVDWTSLPVERDPSSVEYSSYYPDWSYGYGYGPSTKTTKTYSTYDDFDDYKHFTKDKKTNSKTYFYDKKYNYISSFSIDRTTGNYTHVDLDKKRLDIEKDFILEFLRQIEIDFNTINWDGLELTILHGDGRKNIVTRLELVEYIEEMDLVAINEEITKANKIEANKKIVPRISEEEFDKKIIAISRMGETNNESILSDYGYNDSDFYN